MELWPVWCPASCGSRSTTATDRPLRATAYAVASPTMPPPTTTTSYRGVLMRVSVSRTVPAGSARSTGAAGARSRTADSDAGSIEPAAVTTAAASSPGAPLDTAAATAACSAVSRSDASATVAAA